MLQDLRFGLKLLGNSAADSGAVHRGEHGDFHGAERGDSEPAAVSEAGPPGHDVQHLSGAGFTRRGWNSGPDYADRKQLTDVFEPVAMIGGLGTMWAPEARRRASKPNRFTLSFFQILRAW